MIIVYGWQTDVKKEKNLGNSRCTNCNHDEEQFLAKEVYKFKLFGIPVIRKTKRRFIMCNNCGILEELEKEEYKERLKEQ